MPDEDKSVEAQAKREEIERLEATEKAPRGNVHSEPEDKARQADAPPPLPN